MKLTMVCDQGGGKALYRCDCGVEKVLKKADVFPKGGTKSCGCWRKEQTRQRSTKHGIKANRHKPSRTYSCWVEMRKRCNNPNFVYYRHYGGRGITICERWEDFNNFLADMGECPEGLTIERIDNNGHYCPENCRWATRLEQSNNRRDTLRLEAFGRVGTLTDWSALLPVNRETLYRRVYSGKEPEEALTYRLSPEQIEELRAKAKATLPLAQVTPAKYEPFTYPC